MPSSRLFICLIASSFVAARAVFALGDPAYAPCILNSSGASVTFVAKFADGSSSPGALPSSSAAWQHIKGRHLASLEVDRAGHKRAYASSMLDEIRLHHPVRQEL